MKIENAFDPIDLSFLFLALKKLDFGQNFINWIEKLLNGVLSMTEGQLLVSLYTEMPASVTHFLNIFLLSTKENSEIQETEIFDHCYHYSA